MMSADASLSAFPDGDNIFQWTGTITGGGDTVGSPRTLPPPPARARWIQTRIHPVASELLGPHPASGPRHAPYSEQGADGQDCGWSRDAAGL